MDTFKTLEPVKLYVSAASTGARFLSRNGTSKPHTRSSTSSLFLGKLPIDLYELILTHLPIPSIPQFSLCSKAFARLVKDGKHWEHRWKSLQIDKHALGPILDELENRQRTQIAVSQASAPPTIQVDAEDDFGEFSIASVHATSSLEFGDFVGAGGFTPTTPTLFRSIAFTTPTTQQQPFRANFIRAFKLTRALLPSLQSPSHLILSTLFPPPALSIKQQSQILKLLQLFLSPAIQPLRNWLSLRNILSSAIDRFDANLLTVFDNADGRKDELGMKEAAWASWEVWDDSKGPEGWELGKVWGEKQDIFYESGQWDPMKNFSQQGVLQFDAMDEFMSHVLDTITRHGSIAVRVFPPASGVLVAFADRLANEVVAEYTVPLLTHARAISNEVFLRATAASFVQSWRIVDELLSIAGDPPVLSQTEAEDVIYRMFEQHMDEYLDEEVEWVKNAFETVCRDWDRKHSTHISAGSPTATRFLTSQNPAQMKRNVLASLTDVLLMPVTIVPRTVGAVGAFVTTSGTAAVSGIAMLNPQRWAGNAQSNKAANGYSMSFDDKNSSALFDESDNEEEVQAPSDEQETPSSLNSQSTATLELPSHTPSPRSVSPNPGGFDTLELLLSLDVALEIIHADRESLKRVETFQGYPGHYGHKVRENIEELFILMLMALSERHITPGFAAATEQMRTYRPAEHEETTSVAPLMQFFELVHVGDMMQSMVQVFFDKEMAPHIDRTDFLNAVMREKKRFENALDESVASGLNAGTEVLMNQVEHIITTQTGARVYYPQEGAQMDLGPTKGCVEAIKCLEMHCKLLKGSTSKEVLEVFYQEVGIRLHAIIQKHIKRQIISLDGGFQVIADLNAYHAFVTTLKVTAIISDFAHLKMLGHVYIVQDAKDLAQIVRDVARYGGTFRPEDIYEFIQRRSDWKKIEKTVDKTMYNLSFKEDCIIC